MFVLVTLVSGQEDDPLAALGKLQSSHIHCIVHPLYSMNFYAFAEMADSLDVQILNIPSYSFCDLCKVLMFTAQISSSSCYQMINDTEHH